MSRIKKSPLQKYVNYEINRGNSKEYAQRHLEYLYNEFIINEPIEVKTFDEFMTRVKNICPITQMRVYSQEELLNMSISERSDVFRKKAIAIRNTNRVTSIVLSEAAIDILLRNHFINNN